MLLRLSWPVIAPSTPVEVPSALHGFLYALAEARNDLDNYLLT